MVELTTPEAIAVAGMLILLGLALVAGAILSK